MKINSKKSKEMVICFTPDENVRNSIPNWNWNWNFIYLTDSYIILAK